MINLYNRDYGESASSPHIPPDYVPPKYTYTPPESVDTFTEDVSENASIPAGATEPHEKNDIFGIMRKSLSSLGTDDLLLIAIGILLLLDGDSGNDILVLFILAMILF